MVWRRLLKGKNRYCCYCWSCNNNEIRVLANKKNIKIHTLASLNTIMVDGTGMCGACRVTVGGKTKFVCVDGPEFDAHLVDWDELMNRQRIYTDEEKVSLEHHHEHEHQYHCEGH